jgi:beta-glucanase (GH16 family)
MACGHATVTAPPSSVKPVTETPTGGSTAWTLAWSDEFEGRAGTAPDSTKWVHDVGGGGWGNQELEYYTPGAANAALDGDGHLAITAKAESPSGASCWYGACRYTSARLKTKGKFEQTLGRFEARVRIPAGQGMWPAFWMLGNDIDGAGWPKCGEIDVMENIGREPEAVHGTIHGPGYSGAGGIGGPFTLASGRFADDFHVYAVEWEPGVIRWLVDGKEYRSVTPGALPPNTQWVYDHPFFLLLNLAVGGAWPGSPDASTAFPQQMLVDYVRVYRRNP